MQPMLTKIIASRWDSQQPLPRISAVKRMSYDTDTFAALCSSPSE